MSVRHISFSMLEARQACNSISMSSTDSASTHVDSRTSFFGVKLVFQCRYDFPFDCRHGSWWLGPGRAIV